MSELSERAGRAIKVLSLASNPMMDEVAIRLNSGLSYREQEQAEMWEKALKLAADSTKNIFQIACELRD